MRFIFIAQAGQKHTKFLHYSIKEWMTRFDYRKSLNKNISLKTFNFDLIIVYFFILKKDGWK